MGLFATDYRPASEEALRVAAKMSRTFGAGVSVLHVVQSDSHSAAMLLLRKQLSERSQKACLDELAREKVRVAESSFVFGSPAVRIVRKAEHLDADLFAEEPDTEDLRVSRLLFAEAEALMKARSFEPALAKLDQALVRNPFHVPALQMRADACEALGQLDRAARCRRRAEILQTEGSL